VSASNDRFEVHVHDMVAVGRTLEIPRECPRCGASFERDYDPASTTGTVLCHQLDGTTQHANFDPDGGLDWGASTIHEGGYVVESWECANCFHVLAKGQHRDVQGVDVPDTIWNLMHVLRSLIDQYRVGTERVQALLELKEATSGDAEEG
jgi:hypothetical protein